MIGGVECRVCGCYIPKGFDYCLACNGKYNVSHIGPRNIKKALGGIGLVQEPEVTDARREMIDSFCSRMQDKYGVEIRLHMRERPAGLGGMECIVEMVGPTRERLATVVPVGPSARYDDSMFANTVLTNIENKAIKRLLLDYERMEQEISWKAAKLDALKQEIEELVAAPWSWEEEYTWEE